LEHAHAAEVQRLCALLKQVPSDLNRVNRERMTKRERLRVQAESLLNECGQLQADISIM
jgi:hypothetical protein